MAPLGRCTVNLVLIICWQVCPDQRILLLALNVLCGSGQVQRLCGTAARDVETRVTKRTFLMLLNTMSSVSSISPTEQLS